MKTNLKIALFGFLFFLGLGIRFIPLYSLWDDEANTALFAQSVRATGDTSAIRGQNLVAYRGGAELNDQQKARYVSPLQYYFLAPFIGDAPNPVRARVPFFLLSLMALAVLYRRALKLNLPTYLFAEFSILTFSLTSLFLFSVQCRYYALCFLFSALVADCYWFSGLKKNSDFLVLSLGAAFIFISNYLVGVAVVAAMFVHAFLYRRKEIQLTLKRVLLISIPQFLISVPVVFTWNPLGKHVVSLQNSGLDRLVLFYRNARDYNGGHFGSVFLLLLGIFFCSGERKVRFKQYGLLFLTYLLVVSAFSPQPVHGTGLADIRYLFPLVILGIIWTVDFGAELYHRKKFYFYTFVWFFCFTSIPYSGRLEVPFFNLASELIHPASDPYRSASDALEKIGARSGESVQSSLDYATYPLMYLSPQFHYVGQFEAEKYLQPDYWISFCDDSIVSRFPGLYQEVVQVKSACREAFRPELFLRSFGKNQNLGNIKIYKKAQSH